MSVPVTVVVVDESGVTKEMLRMDGAPLVSVQTADQQGVCRGGDRDAS